MDALVRDLLLGRELGRNSAHCHGLGLDLLANTLEFSHLVLETCIPGLLGASKGAGTANSINRHVYSPFFVVCRYLGLSRRTDRRNDGGNRKKDVPASEAAQVKLCLLAEIIGLALYVACFAAILAVGGFIHVTLLSLQFVEHTYKAMVDGPAHCGTNRSSERSAKPSAGGASDHFSDHGFSYARLLTLNRRLLAYRYVTS
ncbi:hypothetical protein [Bradyrhizobium sp. BWA-3-5]|uniref:hypothetical protein n=1 Tax=Bradyrhizobium sp. BWA-3-5 TaxID=3080013 RepID=UPI00293F0E7E|nr:hypothetical protein [Bradyrhizobium sp. BWA-3-5]WOH64331.1 hypothetical protein RX331_27805 [Bradyrhizobium sp. BWA-3-5]